MRSTPHLVVPLASGNWRAGPGNEAVFPELVTKWGDENYLAVDYGRLTSCS